MHVFIAQDYATLSRKTAEVIRDQLEKNIERKGRFVLGLATGSTPLGTYQELVKMHKKENLDFSKVVTFNLDEYVGLAKDHPASYYSFMSDNLFKHINVNLKHIHIPNGNAEDLEEECEEYEHLIERSGGIDLQLLGIGANGHIAFNEPGSSLSSRTRIKTLTAETRHDNARFFADFDKVPRHALTVGIGTIMEAKKLLLLASGEHKAEAVRAALEGPITARCPASMVQFHRYAMILVDEPAASLLKGSYETL
jgi:glucosamine-6-phosphate deaminase